MTYDQFFLHSFTYNRHIEQTSLIDEAIFLSQLFEMHNYYYYRALFSFLRCFCEFIHINNILLRDVSTYNTNVMI